MFDRTVVGWDGGPACRSAIDWAIGEAPRGGTVELVRVEDELELDADALPTAVLHARAALFEEASRLDALHREVTVRAVFAVGDAESVLTRRAGPGGLVVLGSNEPALGRRATVPRRVVSVPDRSVALIPVLRRRGPVYMGVGPTTNDSAVLLASDIAARSGSTLFLLQAGGITGAPRPSATELVAVVHGAHPGLLTHVVLTSRSPVEALERAGEKASAVIVGPRIAGSGTRESLVGRVASPVLLLGSRFDPLDPALHAAERAISA
ncbi:MAG: universal stress protein [Acidobacteria bacterium]|nr:universal stress protein [Acidobacteriota bacterium]